MSYPERYRGNESGANGRMGYPIDSSSPRRAIDDYRDRRRNYTENQTAENRRMMEDTAQRHVDEVVMEIREITRDVDQPMKMKIKDTLTKLVNEMA